jgi:hypothetical protein
MNVRSLFYWVVPILFVACAATEKTGTTSTEKNWFPMEVDSYWVYADSVWKNNDFIVSKIDTVRVLESFEFNGFTAYRFSSKISYYAKGDSIYQIYLGESGTEESSLAFYRARQGSFQCTVTGDQIFQRTISEIKNNYLYTDECESATVIEPLVGIKETVFQNCNVPNIVKRKRSLISYELSKD